MGAASSWNCHSPGPVLPTKHRKKSVESHGASHDTQEAQTAWGAGNVVQGCGKGADVMQAGAKSKTAGGGHRQPAGGHAVGHGKHLVSLAHVQLMVASMGHLWPPCRAAKLLLGVVAGNMRVGGRDEDGNQGGQHGGNHDGPESCAAGSRWADKLD